MLAVSAMPNDFTREFRRKLAEGRTTDQALAELRAAGASIVACIVAVKQLRRCDIVEAKKVVHFSSAWADQKEFHDRFHSDLQQAAQEFTEENV
jgi:hypothetical protein